MTMISQDLHVCLLPLKITWGDKMANLSRLEDTLKRVHPQTDVVVLPETFSTGFPVDKDKELVRELAERNSGETVSRLQELASRYNVAIAGSFIADTGGSLYNRGFFIEPGGESTFEDKHHLFHMAGEDKVFSHGYERMLIRYRGWNIAMVECYDIRFPVWCRNVDNEYDVLFVVANWPEVRIDAWNKLLPARAIENQAYVCGVNCTGIDDKGFVYPESSGTLDFKGRDISVLQESTGLIYATLMRDKLDAFRVKFAAWRDADPFKLL